MNDLIEQFKILLVIIFGLVLPLAITFRFIHQDMKKKEKKS